MAFDAFLKIEGIDGESTDKIHPGEIEIQSFSWGVENTGGTIGGGGGGTGKATPQDFHFNSAVSKAAPSLMLACATGRHFQKATLTCRKAGATSLAAEFLKIRLDDCLISSYNTEGTAESDVGGPTDQFSINFTKIDFLYTVLKTGETVESSFDFSAFVGT
jgi:type VI secretion system secreted protein Hcp